MELGPRVAERKITKPDLFDALLRPTHWERFSSCVQLVVFSLVVKRDGLSATLQQWGHVRSRRKSDLCCIDATGNGGKGSSLDRNFLKLTFVGFDFPSQDLPIYVVNASTAVYAKRKK